MKFKIVCNGKVIGESNLEGFDAGMNVRSGKFYPTKEYEKVREIFLLFSKAHPKTSRENYDESQIKQYYGLREKLDLFVISDDNSRLTGQIHIEDFSLEAGEEGYSVIVYPK
jgi:hypothetical protein